MNRELGLVKVLGADAVGQPGQRRFRLFVQSIRGSAIMWMEKEQLSSLSLALDRLLAHLTEGQVLRTEARAEGQPTPVSMPSAFPTTPTYEFQVGQMNLSYDEERIAFMLAVIPLEIIIEPELEAHIKMREEDVVSFFFTLYDAQALSSSIAVIVTAGRPVCPLCHTPLDGGPHACVKQNGHREILQGEGKEDEE